MGRPNANHVDSNCSMKGRLSHHGPNLAERLPAGHAPGIHTLAVFIVLQAPHDLYKAHINGRELKGAAATRTASLVPVL